MTPASDSVARLVQDLTLPGSGSPGLVGEAEKTIDAYENRILDEAPWLNTMATRQRLNAIRLRLREPIRLSFVGDFSAGKSSIINSLFRQAVAPVDVKKATATICYFRYGDRRLVRLYFRDGTSQELAIPLFQQLVNSAENDPVLGETVRNLSHADIFLPIEVLRDVTIVDTPGFGSHAEAHDELTRKHLEDADAVCWVFDSQDVAKKDEIERIRKLPRHLRRAFAIVNKAETKPPSERESLVRRVHEQCPDRFQEVLLYSAKVVYESNQVGATPPAESKTRHLCRDLTDHIRSRVRDAADLLRADQAASELRRLAAEHAEGSRARVGLVEEVATYFERDAAGMHREARDSWPRQARRHREALEGRIKAAIQDHLRAFRECFQHEEGVFRNAFRMDCERLVQVQNRLSDQISEAFLPWMEYLVRTIDEVGQTYSKLFEAHRGNPLIAEIDRELTPLEMAYHHSGKAHLIAELVRVPHFFTLGTIAGFFRTTRSDHRNEAVAAYFSRVADADLTEFLNNMFCVDQTLAAIDRMVAAPSGTDPSVAGYFEGLEKIYQSQAEIYKQRLQKTRTISSWIEGISKGQGFPER
jgi:GTP-binding protein EngB required for normal cell division